MKAVIWSANADAIGEAAAAAAAAGLGNAVVALTSAHGPADGLAKALAKRVEAESADLVIIVADRLGSEVAPYLSALLDRPLVARVHAIRGDGGLVADRKYLGGRTVATLRVAGPAVVTVNQHAFEAVPVRAENLEPEASALEVVERKARATGGVNIEDADVVVAFGRGIKSKDDMQLCFDLAEKLGGEVGCSRPIAQDLHWLGDERWIGLSGKNVKPKLYVAVGVSGQIQHVAGCRDAGVMVVINTDKNAPFFKMADYGIVGDLYKVVPELLKQLG